ncbi:hypothetical protein SB5439_04959 [Klebsiella variicola]|uniref:hypothetical protein n=1 Tax=Klebsiella variicola TaxID=244366 RepID=UPI00109C937B|nr:hypothetical protein [Klebsiella variicola]VGQ11506.1 hypothetical protein SB5439_04959 [Klebsiella variicola]
MLIHAQTGMRVMPAGTVAPELPEAFDETGTLKAMPATYWQEKTRTDRMLFGHKNALYAFPTIEGIEHINSLIGDRSAIEIGAGNGAFCKALGIPGTDSYQQAHPHYAMLYKLQGQPTINYGAHVRRMDALQAVKFHKPKIVIAAWVTHKYDPLRHANGGNEAGVDEHALLRKVDEYIFIGNSNIHQTKLIFEDIECGIIKTHAVENIIMDSRLFPSRAQGGVDFLVHIKRKKKN